MLPEHATMTDRFIKVQEQAKLILRGVKPRGAAVVANRTEMKP